MTLSTKTNVDRPNVLLIMSDQHHAGMMGCAGDPVVQTPALDRLASEGVRFSNAYCNFPLCGPSRMSFMACQHPHEVGVWDNDTALFSGTPTFAHSFLSGGYDTVLSGRMHFVGQDQRHGFAERLVGDVQESAYLSAGWKLKRVLGELVVTPGMSRVGVTKSGPGQSGYHAYDETVTRVTADWLRRRGAEAGEGRPPFMLTVGYVSPHCPFVCPPEDFDRYAALISPDDLPVPDEPMHPAYAERRKRFETDPPPPRDAQWRARVAYYGLCSFVDRQVGAVLEALADSGLADNTIVVYTSDHGELLGEHGMWWKSSFYDGASRVPLIVSQPGRIAGGRNEARNVSLMDIGTTLIDMNGLPSLPGASGRSFLPLLSGEADGYDDTVFVEHAWGGGLPCGRMVRRGPWKYVYHHGLPAELFNLEDDPGEQVNLCEDPGMAAVRRELHDAVMCGWDPERVVACLARRGAERRLIGDWVRATCPAEPDPVWFEAPPENWVDETVTPAGAS